jgi:esterase
VHVLADAGHWLHVDDPEGLFAILRSALSASLPNE